MSSKRRRFPGELKAKVALEVLRGERTLREIASTYQVQPTLRPRRATARRRYPTPRRRSLP